MLTPPALVGSSRDIEIDARYPQLNSTLAQLHRRVLVNIATQEYLPLTHNLLCSVRRWSPAAGGAPGDGAGSSTLVVGADSWVCEEIRAVHSGVACLEPTRPHLAVSASEVYALKLRLAARVAGSGHDALMADSATIFVSDPWIALGIRGTPSVPPSVPPPDLLLSFQDKSCLDWSNCASRLAAAPNPEHASTILFAARGTAAAAATLEAAAALLRDEPQHYGDQEALRACLPSPPSSPRTHTTSAAASAAASAPRPPVAWGFLPFPRFVRSMGWHAPGMVAGHDDAALFGHLAPPQPPLVAYAAGMTQRGLPAPERVEVKVAALRRARLWLVGGAAAGDGGGENESEGEAERRAAAAAAAAARMRRELLGSASSAVSCDDAWRWRGFERDPWRPPPPPDTSELTAVLGSFPIARAALEPEAIRRLYTDAVLLLQQPRRKAPRAWWLAALQVRALEALWIDHFPTATAADAAHHARTWFALYRAASPSALWRVAERAERADGWEPREQGVMALHVAVRDTCRGWLVRLHDAALATAFHHGDAGRWQRELDEAHGELGLVLSGVEAASSVVDGAVAESVRWLRDRARGAGRDELRSR